MSTLPVVVRPGSKTTTCVASSAMVAMPVALAMKTGSASVTGPPPPLPPPCVIGIALINSLRRQCIVLSCGRRKPNRHKLKRHKQRGVLRGAHAKVLDGVSADQPDRVAGGQRVAASALQECCRVVRVVVEDGACVEREQHVD